MTAGWWCSAGKAIPCTVGTWNTNDGTVRDSAASCKPCPADATTRAQNSSSRDACICNAGFYMNKSRECERCPIPGTRCTELGATLARLPIEPGYWRISRESVDVRACPDERKEGGSGCTGDPDAQCAFGLTGVSGRELLMSCKLPVASHKLQRTAA